MTDTILHHLTDELLLAYSAGSLPEAFSLVAATHISLCDECRARLGSYEALGGEVLDQSGAAAVGDDSLEATLARITGAPPAVPMQKARARGIFPAPLQDYVGGDIGAVRWRAVGMGVKQAILPTSTDATVRLLYIPAGAAMPGHSHRGRELTLVLQGAFRDEDGRYGRGDIEVADEDVEHRPVAEDGADCICLAATEAPLKFRGLLPRLAQPFLNI
jgi:putative transcriptional regulator